MNNELFLIMRQREQKFY